VHLKRDQKYRADLGRGFQADVPRPARVLRLRNFGLAQQQATPVPAVIHGFPGAVKEPERADMLHKVRLDVGFGIQELQVEDDEFEHLVKISKEASNDNAREPDSSAPEFIPRRWPGMGYPRGWEDDEE
jgi:hypothetical protein